MEDIQFGSHTIRSHGTIVARFHMYDWIILVLLGIIDIILNVVEPFHRFVGKDMMTDLRYPLKGNTIPFWAVPLIGIILPTFVITGIYFKKQNVYDLHNAILGLLYSVLITAVLTDAIKDAVGRPRPDFFWRCFPDGIDNYDNVTTSVICHGDKSVIKEGHKSFPSGHSSWTKVDFITAALKAFYCCSGLFLLYHLSHESFKVGSFSGKGGIVIPFFWLFKEKEMRKANYELIPSLFSQGSFAGLGFFAWYLAGKIRVFDRRGHIAKICMVLLPLLCAALIAISRLDDYRHHWQDVFAGGFLGLVVASFCYLQFFPPPYDSDGWGPHAFFQALAESTSAAMPVEIEAMPIPSEEQNHMVLQDSNPILDEIEAGVDSRRQ